MAIPLSLSSLSHALESLDATLLVEHYADDAVFDDTVDGRVVQGRAALLQMYRLLFSLPATRFAVIGGFTSENGAALQWTWEADNPETGEHRLVRGASIIEFRDGKIARETIFYDGRQAPA